MWSTRPLAELSDQLRSSLEAVEGAVDASAYAFGEECRREVGAPTFSVMETDFRVILEVDSLHNEQAMGDAISATMRAIQALPTDQIPGARLGRVEFEFREPGGQSLRLNFDIALYNEEAANLEGAALFNFLQNAK